MPGGIRDGSSHGGILIMDRHTSNQERGHTADNQADDIAGLVLHYLSIH